MTTTGTASARPRTPFPSGSGHSDAALSRAATRADGWMPIFLTADRYGAARDRLQALVVDAGRRPDESRRGRWPSPQDRP